MQKKFSAFYGTLKSTTVLTSARHLSLSWANPIQSPQPLPTSWRSILMLSSHLRLGLPIGLFASGFLTKTLCTPLPSSITYHNTICNYQCVPKTVTHNNKYCILYRFNGICWYCVYMMIVGQYFVTGSGKDSICNVRVCVCPTNWFMFNFYKICLAHKIYVVKHSECDTHIIYTRICILLYMWNALMPKYFGFCLPIVFCFAYDF